MACYSAAIDGVWALDGAARTDRRISAVAAAWRTTRIGFMGDTDEKVVVGDRAIFLYGRNRALMDVLSLEDAC